MSCFSGRQLAVALLVGLVVALASGVAVWIQTVLVLFGTKEWRFELMTLEWPEQTDTGVEGYKRMELSEEDVKSIRPDSLS